MAKKTIDAESTELTKQESSAIATYGDWTPEQMEKEGKELSTGGDFWKAPVGKTAVRFLPPKIGWPSPFVIQHQHFIRMPGLDRPVVFCCPKMHEAKPCAACLKADKLETSGNPRDERAAKQLRPQRRVLANVVVDPKNEAARPVIWTFGATVYNQLKSIREDEEAGGNFLDPKRGFVVVVKREGTGKDDTKYTLLPSKNVTPLANMEWIEMQSDLRRMVKIPTMSQQERLLAGEDPKEVWAESRAERSRKQYDDENDLDGGGPGPSRSAEDDLFDDEVDLD